MQLVQIGQPTEAQQVTILEMFQRLAQKEADFIREAKERVTSAAAVLTNG